MVSIALGMAILAACSPSSLVDVKVPNTVVDPSQVTTPTAALQYYNSAVAWFELPLASYNCSGEVVCAAAIFTDELMETDRTGAAPLDARRLSGSTDDVRNSTGNLYNLLHQARIQAQQAREGLRRYAPDAPVALQGRLQALEGYTVLYFAELFCSGIPLTAVPLVGAPQPTAGFTTSELYERAIALFDSAMVAGADSARFVNLARVGKGRALLGLGRFAEAAAAVQAVPTDFVYLSQASTQFQNDLSRQFDVYRAQDREGTNGLDWSADRRTAIVVLPELAGSMLWPSKYFVTSTGALDPTTPQPYAPIRVADGLEARLIEAEAALSANDASWLTTLNMLRATCVGAAACAPVPGLTADSLPPLADPGTPALRLDTLMKERAMWLYMTGHREGDLRRMAHIYQRNPSTLWPTGAISAPAFSPLYSDRLSTDGTNYGSDVVFLPSPDERTNNPKYAGCFDLNP